VSLGALAPARRKLLVNAGCGRKGGGNVPAMFGTWRELRLDVDPAVEPDILADITDLSAIPSSSVDAIWSSHCIEHLFVHDVGRALAEFHRVLREGAFACLIVPDLQTIARYIVADRLHEVIYASPAGPVTAHDILFGFGPALAQGHVSMAHRCGFTPTVMMQRLGEIGFAEAVLRRRPNFELAALVLKGPAPSPEERDALLARLEL
jgi:SAM-dependent methyltransferase